LTALPSRIQQHLTGCARRIAFDPRRQRGIEFLGQRQALTLRYRQEQIDHRRQQRAKQQRLVDQIEPCPLDFGKVEHFIEHREQRFAR